jgi:hypothetical protein
MRLILIALLLSGCAHSPTFTDRTVTVRIIIVDYDLKQSGGEEAYALAWPEARPCLIKIERKHYKHEIIGHEIRHCFDGYWHD